MIKAEKLFLKYITQLSIIIRLHVSKQCLYILDRHDKVTLQYIPQLFIIKRRYFKWVKTFF